LEEVHMANTRVDILDPLPFNDSLDDIDNLSHIVERFAEVSSLQNMKSSKAEIRQTNGRIDIS
jgi:hypothetical protein